jgi:DNA cross-link repair 1A protein
VNSKVYCDTRKAAILQCEGDPELDALLTSNPREAMIHLVPLGTITSDHLKTYLSRYKGFYTNVIGFRPTGWTCAMFNYSAFDCVPNIVVLSFVPAAGNNTLPSISSILAKGSTLRDFKHIDLKVSGNSTSTVQVYPVPYSEHSSFYELTCFAMSFSWVRMIATVNVGSESSRGKMKRWVDRWEAERKKRIEDTIVPYRHPDYW